LPHRAIADPVLLLDLRVGRQQLAWLAVAAADLVTQMLGQRLPSGHAGLPRSRHRGYQVNWVNTVRDHHIDMVDHIAVAWLASLGRTWDTPPAVADADAPRGPDSGSRGRHRAPPCAPTRRPGRGSCARSGWVHPARPPHPPGGRAAHPRR